MLLLLTFTVLLKLVIIATGSPQEPQQAVPQSPSSDLNSSVVVVAPPQPPPPPLQPLQPPAPQQAPLASQLKPQLQPTSLLLQPPPPNGANNANPSDIAAIATTFTTSAPSIASTISNKINNQLTQPVASQPSDTQLLPTKPPLVLLPRTTVAQPEFASTTNLLSSSMPSIVTIDVSNLTSTTPLIVQPTRAPVSSDPQPADVAFELISTTSAPSLQAQPQRPIANLTQSAPIDNSPQIQPMIPMLQPQPSQRVSSSSPSSSTGTPVVATTVSTHDWTLHSLSAPDFTPSPAATDAPVSIPTTPMPQQTFNSTIAPRGSSGPRPESRRLSDGTANSPVQFLKPKSKFKCLLPSDCLNGGICANGTCFCPPGYTAETCAINIDECRMVSNEEPCFNNGICIDEVNQFRCECAPGYKGERCQEAVDMCAENSCLNGAKCINHRIDYSCECEPGWEGRFCQKNIDECLKNPCQNNGTCYDLVNNYRCDCGTSGFTGKNCETDFDDCAAKPCGFGAKECIDLTGDFKCICYDGFTGKKCDIDIDECQTNPCENNGTCIEKSQNIHSMHNTTTDLGMYHEIRDQNLSSNLNISQYVGYTCECKEEFYGDRCEERKKCYTKSVFELCNNQQAECVNTGSSYECLINASFDGSGQNYAIYKVIGEFKMKEIYVKYRSLTGGIIMSFETTQADSIADLQLNKSGLYLSGAPIKRDENIKFDELLDGNEREIRLGLDSPTEVKSIFLTRQTMINGYHVPFKGCLMQVRLNNQLVPLVDYGTNLNHTFEISENHLEVGQCRTCFEKDCLNHGRCEFQEGYDHCTCPDSFTGNFCEIDVNECEKIHCLNGGTCENFHGGYRCNCKEGYRGEKCQEISDYCKAKQPCVTGVCKNINPSQGTYQCECPSSHIGKRCERKRDCVTECHSHYARCVNNVTCACLPGRREDRSKCEYVSSCDQIEGDLCLHGGTCKNSEIGGYSCVCPEPFHGPICQFAMEKSHGLITLIAATCALLFVGACLVMSLVVFRSVRKARATRGTYSPSTQEKFGNAASDLLKLPVPERLI